LDAVFADASRPLHLDIGCARGRFLLRMADVEPGWNFLGVEIREPLVDEANRLASEAGLKNLHYAFCNAMLWLGRLVTDVPGDRLQIVTIQFPDPWFKKKHAKRRMVNSELVQSIVDKLAHGGKIFVQTDIAFLAEEMHELFISEKRLIELECRSNPFPISTERESAVESKDAPVYRYQFEKK
jgi:tRNA (guanine-N7-)-methyltransferase